MTEHKHFLSRGLLNKTTQMLLDIITSVFILRFIQKAQMFQRFLKVVHVGFCHTKTKPS